MGHEATPWKITAKGGGCCTIGTSTSHTIARVGGRTQRQAFANAVRIVRCVNLCEGLTTVEIRKFSQEARNRCQEVAGKAPRMAKGFRRPAVEVARMG
jgi:hypothetical protein